ncbi:MAG: DUF262 domain-containing protein [Fusobacterium sp. JB019]|nr:DUF262 domain-containing protein [Fusobacterium sp. JB019]
MKKDILEELTIFLEVYKCIDLENQDKFLIFEKLKKKLKESNPEISDILEIKNEDEIRLKLMGLILSRVLPFFKNEKNLLDEETINDLIILSKNRNAEKNFYDKLNKIYEHLSFEKKRRNLNYHISKQVNYSEINYSVSYLIQEFSSGRMKMPKYQRDYVWTIDQASELILSLLRGIPIPKLYGYNDYDETLNKNIKLIIDGQQRITSILMWFYGIFPKFKIRTINYSEYMSEIVKLCNYYYYPDSYRQEANRKQSEEERLDMLEQIENAKQTLESKYKLNLNASFLANIAGENSEFEKTDISYRSSKSILTPKEKQDLLDKELGFVIVKGEKTSETVDIFRLYNSAGTQLSEQEIRNGIYYRNELYKLINQFNEETGRQPKTNKIIHKNWNNIKPRDTYKNDVKQLFHMLACVHDLKKYNTSDFENLLNSNKNIDILTEKREELINNYSAVISNENKNSLKLRSEFETITNFFELKFNNKNIPKNIKAYTALFIILKKLELLNKDLDYKKITIPCEIICCKNENSKKSYISFEYLRKIYKILKLKGVLNEFKK